MRRKYGPDRHSGRLCLAGPPDTRPPSHRACRGGRPNPEKNRDRVAGLFAAPAMDFVSGERRHDRRVAGGPASRSERAPTMDATRARRTRDRARQVLVCPPPPVAVRPVPGVRRCGQGRVPGSPGVATSDSQSPDTRGLGLESTFAEDKCSWNVEPTIRWQSDRRHPLGRAIGANNPGRTRLSGFKTPRMWLASSHVQGFPTGGGIQTGGRNVTGQRTSLAFGDE